MGQDSHPSSYLAVFGKWSSIPCDRFAESPLERANPGGSAVFFLHTDSLHAPPVGWGNLHHRLGFGCCFGGPAMGARNSWRELQKAYLAFLCGKPSSRDSRWLAIWQSFIEHPYYQRQLRLIVRDIIRHASDVGPTERELRMALTMVLAKRIQSRRDLESVQLIKHAFPDWLKSALLEDCRFACTLSLDATLSPGEPSVRYGIAEKIQLQVHEIAANLADPLRSVLLLHLLGFTPSRIARSLDLNRSHVDRLIRSGLELLALRLRRRR